MEDPLENAEDTPFVAKSLDDPANRVETESLLDSLKSDETSQAHEEIEEPNLEETKQAADELEDSFTIPKEFNRLTKKQLAEKAVKAANDAEKEKELRKKVEHRASKVGHELGEMRSAYDDYIKSQMEPKQKPEEPLQFDDFVENTQGSIDRGISESSKVREMEQQLNALRQESALVAFQNKHPDWTEMSQTESFREFVRGDEALMGLAAQAQAHTDYNAASTLANLYKYATAQAAANKAEKRKESVALASTESGTTGSAPTKRWRKSEIQKMIQYDQPKYKAHMQEIAEAYRNKQVIDDINVF